MDIYEDFSTTDTVRQGDALPCLVVERAVQKSDMKVTGTIFNRLVQLLINADDLDIFARPESVFKEAFLSLQEGTMKLEL